MVLKGENKSFLLPKKKRNLFSTTVLTAIEGVRKSNKSSMATKIVNNLIWANLERS
jgi:hypothetical protein